MSTQVPSPAPLTALLRVAGPDDPAWFAADGDRSFGEAVERCARLAAAVGAEVGNGAVVAVLGENSGRYVECLYGIPEAGGQALLLNYRHHPLEWVAMLQRTATTLVIGDAALLDTLGPVAEEQGLTVRMVAFDRDYEDFLANAPTAAPSRPVDPNATAWLVPTSGTTGTPKLAMLTHRSLQVAAFGCHVARPVRADDVYLFPFPLCHVAAYNVLVYHQFGRPIVLLRRFDPEAVVDAIARQRCTSASLAPTMIATMLDTPGLLDGRDLSSLHTVGYGSSGIAAPLLRRAMSTLGCGFSQGYGMTELSGNAVFLDADDHARGIDGEPEFLVRAGQATPLAEVRIVDTDGHSVPAGTVGEIAVRGEQVMAGYFNDPAATASAVRDGWLHTGDLGLLTDDGYLQVVDRLKDVIISGGENVASREVEGVLHEHPGVREVAVIGVPDERWGEVVVAVVARRAGSDVTADELIAHCRSFLAGYKQPRRIEFIAELPKNTTGKVEKHRLRSEYRDPS